MCRRRRVQQQRVHENHVAGPRGVFQHLQRDPVNLLDSRVKPFDTACRVARSAEITEIGMAVNGGSQLSGAGARPRRMIDEPAVDEPMGRVEDVHPASLRFDIAEHRVDLDALRRLQRTGVVGVNVPAVAGHVPWPTFGKTRKNAPQSEGRRQG